MQGVARTALRRSTKMARLLMLLVGLAMLEVAWGRAAQQANEKVALQVFYESLCPDSVRFVNDQLMPTFDVIGSERMVVDFVPYGLAQTNKTDSGFTFKCQHGASECRGNTLQACGLSRLSDNTKQVKFVFCLESQTDPSLSNTTCITDAGLDENQVNSCTDGEEGQKLLAGMGDKTPHNMTWVPSIYFNGVYNQTDQDQGEKDLLTVICNKLAADERPAACNGSTATSTSVGSMLLLSFSSIILTVFVR